MEVFGNKTIIETLALVGLFNELQHKLKKGTIYFNDVSNLNEINELLLITENNDIVSRVAFASGFGSEDIGESYVASCYSDLFTGSTFKYVNDEKYEPYIEVCLDDLEIKKFIITEDSWFCTVLGLSY